MPMLHIALPSKGRLHAPSVEILNRAGIKILDSSDRQLFANTIDKDIQILFARAFDIPAFVYKGVADIGVTGYDVVKENGYDVDILLDLKFGYAKLVVAVPENSGIESIEDLPENAKIATEFPNLARKFFNSVGKNVEVVKVSGATEITPHIGIADAIVDLTSTGTTLKVNRLRVIAEILSTNAVLIANKRSYKNKRNKIEKIVLAIKSVLMAENKKLVMMNVPEEVIEEIKKIMPGMAGPTIAKVASEKPMLAVHAVVDEKDVYEIITKAKKIGARDILVLPIERIIP